MKYWIIFIDLIVLLILEAVSLFFNFSFLMAKHEIIPCERCGTPIECKANSYTKCQCSIVQLNLNEVQYISELHEGCLCAKCLFELQEEYRETL